MNNTIADMNLAIETPEMNPENILESIRGVSNVIQALENLLSQCDDLPGYQGLAMLTTTHLKAARDDLRRMIHRR